MAYCPIERDRCIIFAQYLIEHQTTVRGVAAHFDISKSTVHKDITQTLKNVNPALYTEAKALVELNKKERHIRPGSLAWRPKKGIKIRNV